jgi:hypothetical protein
METTQTEQGTINTQKSRIMAHMLKGHEISPIVASQKFGCTKLTNRISELQAQYGIGIQRRYETKINADGNRSTFMVYWLTSSQINEILRINKKQKANEKI